MNHKYMMGFGTTLKYKGLSLAVNFDYRKGGLMFSRTKDIQYFTGNAMQTAYNDRNPWVIPNSVVSDGNGGYVENTTPIMLGGDDYGVGDYQTYYNDFGWGQGGEAYLLDKSFVKLRNITLAYQLPKAWVSQLYLSDITLSLFCNNVFTWTHKSNTFIDPEGSTTGNDLEGQFGELYVNPSCRSFGFNVGIKF